MGDAVAGLNPFHKSDVLDAAQKDAQARARADIAQNTKLDTAPPPPVSPVDLIIKRAMAAERMRQLSRTSNPFLTGPRGLPGLAPTYVPKATGT